MKVPDCCVVEGCVRPVFVDAPFVQVLVHVPSLGDHEVSLRLCRVCRDLLVTGVRLVLSPDDPTAVPPNFRLRQEENLR